MEKIECFLCSNMGTVNLKISNTITKYQKIPINSILHAFAGNEHIEIAITNTDSICLMCKLLLDELDCMRLKLRNIENIIAHKLHRKYQFDDIESKLPAIHLDEQTTNLYGYGKNGHKFQCMKCSFSTDFQDCLFPHNLYHLCGESIAENKIAEADIDDFPCENCQLILPSEELFKQHMTMFHAPIIIDNQQIDLNDEDLDEQQQKSFQCEVSVSNSKNHSNNLLIFDKIPFKICIRNAKKHFQTSKNT